MTGTEQEKKLRVVIICGPPGAGKGTQAELLVKKYGFYHFETSRIIETVLNGSKSGSIEIDGKLYFYEDERRKFSSGELNSPEAVAFWVKEKIKELAKENKSLVFSGSPRTLFEADKLFPTLIEIFSKENICVINLEVAPEVSIDRNTNRRICSLCRLPHAKDYAGNICQNCGNPLIKRGSLDTASVIIKRLEEYDNRTKPAVLRAKDYGLILYTIDGAREEEIISEDICRTCVL